MKIKLKTVPRVVLIRAALTTILTSMLIGCGGNVPKTEERKISHEGHAEPTSLGSHSHDDPNQTCFICDASKRDKGRLWCKEHARYEDRCWLCHPELEDKDRLYCREHGVYEDECFLCHPELKDEGANASQATGRDMTPHEAKGSSAELFCNEHGVPEIECAICQPDLAASLVPGESLKVRFASRDAADKVGVRTERPKMAEAGPGMRVICEIQYNLNELARVTPLAAGVVRSVLNDVGDRVKAGHVLAELHSVSAASTKSDYLAAIVEQTIWEQAFERESRLKEQQISAEKDYIAAEAKYRSAQLQVKMLAQKLINLGFTGNEIEEIKRTQDTSAKLAIRAPFAGEIIERSAVIGEAVQIGDALFTVADLSTRWITMLIPSSEIGRIQAGLSVEARFDALPKRTFKGRITWVDASIDPRTRMVRARALILEDTEFLKAGLFGEARIHATPAQSSVHVPRDAVQKHEGLDYVFVRDEPDLFALRRVELGGFENGSAYVLAGLGPQDAVVTEGSFIVMSEFLKSRLGAGCVHE